MNKHDYDRLRAKIEAEYKANIDALDRVLALEETPDGKDQPPKPKSPKGGTAKPKKEPDASDNSDGRGSILNAVRESTVRCPGRSAGKMS